MIIDENLPDGGLCLFFLKQVSNYNVHFTCYGGYQGFIFSRYSRIVSLCRFFLLVASNRIQFGLQQWNFSQSFPRRGTNLCIYWPHYCHCGLYDVLEFDKWRHYKLSILYHGNFKNRKEIPSYWRVYEGYLLIMQSQY